MTVEKIAITVDRATLKRVRKAVREKRAASVSAYFSKLAQEQLSADSWESLIADLIAEGGAPSEDDRKWAKQQLGF